MPEATVIIPAHNAGRTIDAALQSVFAQTLQDFEVIVVDDGSTDDTAVRVAAWGPRVTTCYQPQGGPVRAINAGLTLARGRVVALLDPSHVWMSRKLDRQLRYLDAHPLDAMVFGDVIASDSPSAALLESADATPIDEGWASVATRPVDPASDRIELSTVALRRATFEETGLFDAELDTPAALRELSQRIAARSGIGHLAVPLAVIRTQAAAPDGAAATARQRSLLQDTTFRRVRSALTSSVHALDELAAKRSDGPARILFEAASPMSLAVFGPVFRRLRQDPRMQFWFTSCDRSWNARTIFASAGITERVVEPDSVRWAKFDGYINTDFWDMTWLPRRTKRVHFFHGVAGKYGLDAPVKIAPVVATFDRLMFPNRDRLRRYAEAGLVDGDGPQAALIGYPKIDCLVDGSLSREKTLAPLGIDTSRPTVLYAPTWSPYSSLNSMGHDVIAALGQLDVNVVVKLHDRSYDATTRGSGGVDWKCRLQRVCERHGAHLVQDADASPWLHAADLLITDHSSVGFEFMLLDRPIVVLDSPELITHARVNPDKVTMLRRAAFVVHDRDDVLATVREALASPRAHHAERRAIADELFYCPGTATARAVRCIYELLAMPLPEAAGVSLPARGMPALAPLARTL